MNQASAPPVVKVLDARDESCATLTPLIRSVMRGLESGAVLEVRTDDASAREGIASWSRLTGNELLAIIDDGGGCSRFFLRKSGESQ